jgi:hypothetical protein
LLARTRYDHLLAETERRDPSLSTIAAVAKALGCPPGELLGGVRDLSAAGYEAGRLFDAAPDEIQEGILRILRATGKRRR